MCVHCKVARSQILYQLCEAVKWVFPFLVFWVGLLGKERFRDPFFFPGVRAFLTHFYLLAGAKLTSILLEWEKTPLVTVFLPDPAYSAGMPWIATVIWICLDIATSFWVPSVGQMASALTIGSSCVVVLTCTPGFFPFHPPLFLRFCVDVLTPRASECDVIWK